MRIIRKDVTQEVNRLLDEGKSIKEINENKQWLVDFDTYKFGLDDGRVRGSRVFTLIMQEGEEFNEWVKSCKHRFDKNGRDISTHTDNQIILNTPGMYLSKKRMDNDSIIEKDKNELEELRGIIYRAAISEPFDARFDNVSESSKFLIRQLEKARKYDKVMLVVSKEGWFASKECGGFTVSEDELNKSGLDKFGKKIK